MPQYSEGLVRLTNASNVVDGSWIATLTGVTGQLLPAEEITHSSPSFSGRVIVSQAGVLTFFVDSGTPTDGKVIVGQSSGESATWHSPVPQMDWTDTDNAQVGDAFTVSGRRTYSQVDSVVSAAKLTLPVNWPEATLSGIVYAITRDYTTNGLARLNSGDIHTAQLFTRNMDLLEGWFYTPYTTFTVGGGGGAPAFAGAWSQLAGGARSLYFWRDYQGMVHIRGAAKSTTGSAPSTIFTLPAGYRPSADIVGIASNATVASPSTAVAMVVAQANGDVRCLAGTIATGVHLNLSFQGEA